MSQGPDKVPVCSRLFPTSVDPDTSGETSRGHKTRGLKGGNEGGRGRPRKGDGNEKDAALVPGSFPSTALVEFTSGPWRGTHCVFEARCLPLP